MLGLLKEEDMREQAMPYLRDGEELRQVFMGIVASSALRWVPKKRVFAVTGGRCLVLGDKEGLIAELPRSVKFIPARAGRFRLDTPGGLAGLTSLTVTFTLPQYHEKITFGFKSFGAMLAADGREGEKHFVYGRARVLR